MGPANAVSGELAAFVSLDAGAAQLTRLRRSFLLGRKVFLLLSGGGGLYQEFGSQMHLTQMSPTFEAALGNLGDLIFQGDQCVFCVCVCVYLGVAFQNKTLSLAYCVVLWGERYLSLSRSLGLLLCPTSDSVLQSFCRSYLCPIFRAAWDTVPPEPLPFSVMKCGCYDLVFSPAVRCWIKML